MTTTPLPGWPLVLQAYTRAPWDPQRVCQAVDQTARPLIGQRLCTVNAFDAAAMRLTRCYSSDPASYPTGGSKDKSGTAWGRHVLLERRVYVGEGTQAIRAAFDDHDRIAQLGLNSVINVPLVLGERCLGTFNLLMAAATVHADQVECAQTLGLLLLPALLSDATANQLD
jgi:hypothetical protein